MGNQNNPLGGKKLLVNLAIDNVHRWAYEYVILSPGANLVNNAYYGYNFIISVGIRYYPHNPNGGYYKIAELPRKK